MAGSAVQSGVCSQKWKSVLVLLDFIERDRPSFDGVTLLAVRAELTFVDVGVAVRAPCPHIAEYRLDMALRARDTHVHSPQRKLGLIVIELRNASDWFPAGRSVAVLARNIQVPVRAARIRISLRVSRGSKPRTD